MKVVSELEISNEEIKRTVNETMQKEVAKAVKSIDVEGMFARSVKQKCEGKYDRMAQDGRLVKAVADAIVKNINVEKIINEVIGDKDKFLNRITEVAADRIVNNMILQLHSRHEK